MKIEHMIEVMQGYLEGKPVQTRSLFDERAEDWEDVKDEPIWNWDDNEYRLTPNVPVTMYQWVVRDQWNPNIIFITANFYTDVQAMQRNNPEWYPIQKATWTEIKVVL